jgi:hypothetical protein
VSVYGSVFDNLPAACYSPNLTPLHCVASRSQLMNEFMSVFSEKVLLGNLLERDFNGSPLLSKFFLIELFPHGEFSILTTAAAAVGGIFINFSLSRDN